MIADVIRNARRVQREEGADALFRSGCSLAFEKLVKTRPVLHYLSPLEYVTEPRINNIDHLKLYNRRFWIDRYLEVREYYGLSNRELLTIYAKNGFPNHSKWGDKIQERDGVHQHFADDRYSPPPDELLESYRKKHFESVNRFMLGYHRYGIAEQLLELSDSPDLSSVSVLDYGCGVADPALYLASLGADATIVDLDTKVLDMATWRFDQRDLPHSHVRANQTEDPVTVDQDEFDYVIMSQFLEHVRDPMKFLQFAIEKLREGGIFFDPVGREYTHEVGGDHLPEAKETVGSPEYKQLHRSEFEQIRSDYYRKV